MRRRAIYDCEMWKTTMIASLADFLRKKDSYSKEVGCYTSLRNMRPFSKRVTLLLITCLASKSSNVCTSFVLATPTEPTNRDSSWSRNFPSDGVRISARKSNVLSLRMTEPTEKDSLEYKPDKVWKYVQQGESSRFLEAYK